MNSQINMPDGTNGAPPGTTLGEGIVKDPSAAFGQVVWLMLNMPAYRHIFLADLEWMILPAIQLGQYRMQIDANSRPVSFAAWAYLSEEAEKRLNSGNPRLSPQDWKSGELLWVVNVVSPFVPSDTIIADLKATALKGKSFAFHRRFPDGRVMVEKVSIE